MVLSSEATLEALVGAAGRGDAAAFAELYRRTSPRLFGLALLVCKRREWAEDVLQEAFVSVWKRAPDFTTEKGTALAWLTTIVRHRAIDRLRREAPFAPAEATSADVVDQLPDERPGPEAEAERSESARRIRRCLEELDDVQRAAIRLAFFEGLTHRELAARLGAPLGTVKSWVRRGLERLRGCLQQP